MGSLGKREAQKGLECVVEGCGSLRRSKGYCIKHLMALRRFGNVLGGKVDREGLCRVCGSKFRLTKRGQGYCGRECYRKSAEGRAAAYEATRAYRSRNREKLNARGIFRRHPLESGDNCLVCGVGNGLHRHHHNYKDRLDVTVLCGEHHRELHSWDSN